jgi:hypothetical protein
MNFWKIFERNIIDKNILTRNAFYEIQIELFFSQLHSHKRKSTVANGMLSYTFELRYVAEANE